MSGRRAAVVGNWKMNGSSVSALSLTRALVSARQSGGGSGQGVADVIVCPPFPYLSILGPVLRESSILLGAQDVSEHPEGAYTGEVSASMLLDMACAWVIVGHSERRSLFGETDAVVAAKTARALASGLNTIVCVGETLAEREAGHTETVIDRQVAAVMAAFSTVPASRVMIAYEPVWAIGTGRTATPDQAVEVHQRIRRSLSGAGLPAESIRILYGGSVKPANAAELLASVGIDGALVGGASLVADDFLAIVQAAGAA